MAKPANNRATGGGTVIPLRQPPKARLFHAGKQREPMHAAALPVLLLRALKKDAKIVREMLELGDLRLMAMDGPCGGQLPDLSPKQWGKVYRACKRIAARLA